MILYCIFFWESRAEAYHFSQPISLALISVIIYIFCASLLTIKMSPTALTFLASDAALGRFDAASLSQQTRMEMVIADLTEDTQENFKDENGNFTDTCTWSHCECDDAGSMVKFCLGYIEGQLNYDFIPSTVETILVEYTDAEGTLDTSKLPQSLNLFDIPNNFFTGSVDLRTLPPQITKFIVKSNQFSGSIFLDALPSALQELNMSSNNLSGEISLEHLPACLLSLELARNALTGGISLESLPADFMYLDLSFNQLSGELTFDKLPAGIVSVILRYNQFSGELCWSTPLAHVHEINLQSNEFAGTARIHSALPRLLAVQNNAIERAVDEAGERLMCTYDSERNVMTIQL